MAALVPAPRSTAAMPSASAGSAGTRNRAGGLNPPRHMGQAPAVTATIQGETQMMFAVMQPLQPQIQAGKLRAIAVTTAKRFPLLPDLPAIAESGYPGFEALAWNGIMVPAATPKPIVARLNAEINAILKEPDVTAKMHAVGFDLIGGTPEDFGALIRRETDTWAPVIRRLGVKVD